MCVPVLPYLMPPIARSQSMSSFKKAKQKEGTECVCARPHASCGLLRHETGPDGHLRRGRLGLFTCSTLGHVSFVFGSSAARNEPPCQKTALFCSSTSSQPSSTSLSLLQNIILGAVKCDSERTPVALQHLLSQVIF